jgi:hypothetical protein
MKTVICTSDMRSLINLVESSQHSQNLFEAAPWSFGQQLKWAAKALFNPGAQKQFILNQYANNLYRAWLSDSSQLNNATGRDFVEWYATSPQGGGQQLSPLKVNVLKTIMAKKGMELDQPLSSNNAAEVCREIGEQVAKQSSRLRTGLIRGATSQQERRVFEIFNHIDDQLIATQFRLSFNMLHKLLVKALGDEHEKTIQKAWRFFSRYPGAGLILPRERWIYTNRARLSADDKSKLIAILPDFLLLIVKAIDSRSTDSQKPVQQSSTKLPDWQNKQQRLLSIVSQIPDTQLADRLKNIISKAVDAQGYSQALDLVKIALDSRGYTINESYKSLKVSLDEYQ